MARATRRWLLAVTLALLVATAGCSGSGGQQAAEATASNDLSGGNSAEEGSANGDGESKGRNVEFHSQEVEQQMQQRALVRTGKVSVRVEDYDAARRNLTRTTRQFGGFVTDSSEQVHTRDNRTWTTGRVVLRVPKENFSALHSRAKRVGDVREASTSAKDVTDKLVDIDARLTNLRTQRERLRKLYEDANDTENVLAVQERLSEVQSEIERLEARQKSLKEQVAYSTITVQLGESPPERTPTTTERRWYETELLAAFAASVHGLEVLVRSLAVAAAYAMPFVLAFGVPLGGSYAVWRRRSETEPEPESREDE